MQKCSDYYGRCMLINESTSAYLKANTEAISSQVNPVPEFPAILNCRNKPRMTGKLSASEVISNH
jgi:hypothetical protein